MNKFLIIKLILLISMSALQVSAKSITPPDECDQYYDKAQRITCCTNKKSLNPPKSATMFNKKDGLGMHCYSEDLFEKMRKEIENMEESRQQGAPL